MRKRFGTRLAALLLSCTMLMPTTFVQAEETANATETTTIEIAEAATTESVTTISTADEKTETGVENVKISSSGQVVVYYNSGKTRVYRNYLKSSYNKTGSYGSTYGDTVTTVATVLSGLVNFYITPAGIHERPSNYTQAKNYSEEYAIRKISGDYSDYDITTRANRLNKLDKSRPTLLMANEILTRAGLTTKYVKTISSSSYSQVQAHLEKGYPVIFATDKSKTYSGISMTSGTTTMVMLGLDSNGKAIVMNPTAGKANYSTVSKKSFSFTPTQIMKNFAVSAGSDQKLYSGTSGGYILVYPNDSTSSVQGMRLSRSNLEMTVKDTNTLNAYINPGTSDQSVTWKSSDTSVAKVDSDGKVTAVAKGTATITATSVLDNSFSKSCEVTVKAAAVVSKVAVTASKKELGYGEKLQLKVKVTGGDSSTKVTWSSSNTSRATVSQSGLVTSKGTGFVTIKATAGSKSDSVTLYTKRYSPYKLEGDVDVTIYTSSGATRKYKSYSQTAYNGSYGGARGCAVTAAAIVMSGMISNSITPATVHRGTNKYSEKYAISKLGSSYKKYDSLSASARLKKLNSSTPTNLMLVQILKNAGLKTKYVRTLNSNSVSEVYTHLANGNPVILTTKSNKSYKGITLANTWHTLVLVGIDSNGKAIVINPAGGRVNYSHTKKKYFHFSVAELLNNFQVKSQGSTKLYSGGRYGYILVSK